MRFLLLFKPKSMMTTFEKVRDIASAQRVLIWVLTGSVVAWLIPFGMVISIPLLIYSVCRLAIALQLSVPSTMVYVTGLFFPILGLLCLLAVNDKATLALRGAGVHVGVLGARPGDLPAV